MSHIYGNYTTKKNFKETKQLSLSQSKKRIFKNIINIILEKTALLNKENDVTVLFQPVNTVIHRNNFKDLISVINTAENVAVIFYINDKSYDIYDLFHSYTSLELIKYFEAFLAFKLLGTDLLTPRKNPYKQYEKKFPKLLPELQMFLNASFTGMQPVGKTFVAVYIPQIS